MFGFILWGGVGASLCHWHLWLLYFFHVLFPTRFEFLNPILGPAVSCQFAIRWQPSIPQDQTKTKTIRGIQAGPHNYMILVAKNCLKIIIDSQIVHLPGIFHGFRPSLGPSLGSQVGRAQTPLSWARPGIPTGHDPPKAELQIKNDRQGWTSFYTKTGSQTIALGWFDNDALRGVKI